MHVQRRPVRPSATDFTRALQIAHFQFEGLPNEAAYKIAFERLLRKDPRVLLQDPPIDGLPLMIGNDQRDLFVPHLAALIDEMPERFSYFSVGGGNGLTLSLVEDQMAAKGAIISVLEPNRLEIVEYEARVRANPSLALRSVIVEGFHGFIPGQIPLNRDAPMPNSQNLVSGIHMIYFVHDVPRMVEHMYSLLELGGTLFIVFADDTVSYGGVAARYHHQKAGDIPTARNDLATAQSRLEIFDSSAEKGRALVQRLNHVFPGTSASIKTVTSESRLYAHTLQDLMALGLVNMAPPNKDPFDITKLTNIAALLASEGEALDLSVEMSGARAGMFSVTQPQVVAVVRKNTA